MDTKAVQYACGISTFASLKNERQFKRDFEIIQLIEDMSTSADYKRDEKIQKKISQILKAKFDDAEADAEIIKYHRWLNGKLKK